MWFNVKSRAMSSSPIERDCELLHIDRFSAMWLDSQVSNNLSYEYDNLKSGLIFMRWKQLDFFKVLTGFSVKQSMGVNERS